MTILLQTIDHHQQQHRMLIHKNQAELQALVTALQALPIEGKDLTEVVYKEWTRQQSLTAMRANVKSSSECWRMSSTTHSSVSVPTQHTNHPTTLIDDYWGLRLGLIRG
jgi:hypothetical protein